LYICHVHVSVQDDEENKMISLPIIFYYFVAVI